MTTKSGVYTINAAEQQGHENLGLDFTELSIGPLDTEHTKSSPIKLTKDMPTKSGFRVGLKAAIIADVAVFLIALIWVLLTELGYTPNFKQGFYCGDKKISFKFNGDTISATLIGISVIFPIFIVWMVEAIRYEGHNTKGKKLKSSISKTVLWCKDYALGIAAKMFILEILKVLLGELRPHFLDSCRPDAAQNCTEGAYISKYSCTNTMETFYIISDSSRSFPSGHTSISVFEAIFLVWYLQRRCPKSGSYFLVPFLQCLCLSWACVCACTRITDNRHHWWDVLAGFVLGIIFATYTCLIRCNNFSERFKHPEHVNQNGHNSVRRLLSDSGGKDGSTIVMETA